MSLVRNEQTKLTATWLNGIAIAAIAVGTIAPSTAAIVGTAAPAAAIIVGLVWFIAGCGLHVLARLMLRGLRE